MKPQTKSWLLYSTIRVVLFAGIFTLLMLLSIAWWLSAVLAALISACISYIFFHRRRDEIARNLYELRHSGASIEPREDDEIEDAAVDAASGEFTDSARATNEPAVQPLESERHSEAQ